MSSRIILADPQRVELRKIAESPATSTRVATRARIVLALDQNWKVKDVCEALGVSSPTVTLWKRRFLEHGIEGLADRHEPLTSDLELTRLLDAAERTVSQRGFCATRVSDIAFEAGVSPSLLLYYFESRQETLVRAMLHANQRAATRFEEQLAGAGRSATERLAAFVARVLPNEGSQLDEYLLELDLLAHARQFPEFKTIWDDHQRRWIAGLAEIIQDGISDGSFVKPTSEPEVLAQAVIALVDGFCYQIAIGSSIVSSQSMVAAVTSYISSELAIAPEVLKAQ